RIGLEGGAPDRLDPGRKPAIGIGCRHADGFRTEIEPDQRAAFRPVQDGVDQRQNERGHRPAYHAASLARKATGHPTAPTLRRGHAEGAVAAWFETRLRRSSPRGVGPYLRSGQLAASRRTKLRCWKIELEGRRAVAA